MSFGSSVRFALRQTARRRGTTLPALAGLVLATALVAVVVAVTAGERDLLRRRLLAVTPHVTVLADRLEPLVPQRLFDVEGGVVELVVNTPPSQRREIKARVEVATRARRSSAQVREVSPYVALKGVFRNGSRYRAVEIRGVDPSRERSIGRLATSMREGSLPALAGAPEGAIVGVSLAKQLDVATGSDVTMITADGVVRRVRIVGVFRSDVASVDAGRVYVNLVFAQSLRGMARNAATGLGLQLSDAAHAERVARSVERATGYRTVTWEQSQRDILDAHRARQVAAWVVAGLALVIAAFGVANALTSSVLAGRERSSLDAARGAARAPVVVIEALLLGIVGGPFGALLGYGAAQWLWRSGATGLGFADAYVTIERSPVSLDPALYSGAVGLALLTALAASLPAARHAARAEEPQNT